MKELFVPYEIAVKLKALGFDEECIAFYRGTDTILKAIDQHWGCGLTGMSKALGYTINDDEYPAPLYQQVVDWLRDKHRLELTIEGAWATGNVCDGYDWKLHNWRADLDGYTENTEPIYEYYTALLAGIEEAIKLIP